MPLDDTEGGTALIPRATVEQIVAHRNRALQLYEEAFGAIAVADAAMKAAHAEAQEATGGGGPNRYTYEKAAEVQAFHEAVKLSSRDQFLRVARRLTDVSVWGWVVEYTDLRRLMDREAKEKLDRQMRYVPESQITHSLRWTDDKEERERQHRQLIDQHEIDEGLPPVTVENIYATLQQFAGDAETIWRRGIANAFSKLDRRFRSHDGFKIGGRIILTYFFDQSGWMSYSGQTDTLIDIERVFVVLDGKPTGWIGSSIDALRHSRGHGFCARQSEVDTGYFKIRGYKNGNAHLWFSRDDLVEKVNKILAEWYGETIGDGQTQQPDIFDHQAAAARTPAKRWGFFPTPDAAADAVIERVPLYLKDGEAPFSILEPSAGTGNLARRLATARRHGDWEWRDGGRVEIPGEPYGHQVDCIEVQPELARGLEAEGIYRRVTRGDFLRQQPRPRRLYDRVVMNPPFDLERDIDHVVHALKFLKPEGVLVAIMSAGTEFRHTRKAKAFRKMMIERDARFDDLPAGSFAEVGTNVNTIVVTVGGHGYGGRRFEP